MRLVRGLGAAPTRKDHRVRRPCSFAFTKTYRKSTVGGRPSSIPRSRPGFVGSTTIGRSRRRRFAIAKYRTVAMLAERFDRFVVTRMVRSAAWRERCESLRLLSKTATFGIPESKARFQEPPTDDSVAA